MTDRVPGAPGRYSAVIDGEELQKLRNAQPFAITLTRDDQPIKKGTPYCKASVLPDELAAQLCPGMEDPSPKDAFSALYEQNAERKAEIAVERARINNLATLEEGSTTGDAELADARVGHDGIIYESAGEAVRGQIGNLTSDFGELSESVLNASPFDSVEEGTAYNTYNTNGVSWSGGHSYIKNVSVGERYTISTTIPGNPNRVYWGVLYYNDDTYVSGVYQGASDHETTITNYAFRIPPGVNKIVVSTLNAVTPVLYSVSKVLKTERFAKNYAKFDGTTLIVKGRYNSNEDFVVSMKKKGNNNLFEFHQFFTTERASVLNGDFSPVRTLLTTGTDWFSPHQIYSTVKADGDDKAGYFLTGGNHDRNGVPTGYCDNLKVWVDGIETTGFSGICNHIKVTWTNHIQGFNTWKADGSGRTILTEIITLNIEGLKFDVFVEQIPTEDVRQSEYYGLMSTNKPYPKLRFIGGLNRGEIDASVNDVNSGSRDCRRVIAYNPTTGDQLESYIENEDLGTFSKSAQSYSVFTGNNKLYYAILSGGSRLMEQNQLFTLRGYYKFTSTV